MWPSVRTELSLEGQVLRPEFKICTRYAVGSKEILGRSQAQLVAAPKLCISLRPGCYRICKNISICGTRCLPMPQCTPLERTCCPQPKWNELKCHKETRRTVLLSPRICVSRLLHLKEATEKCHTKKLLHFTRHCYTFICFIFYFLF